jgi:hypothetical protein
MPSFEEIHPHDVSGKTYLQQRPGVLQEALIMINIFKYNSFYWINFLLIIKINQINNIFVDF